MAAEQRRVCIWLDSLLSDASNGGTKKPSSPEAGTKTPSSPEVGTTQDSGASHVGTQDLETLKSNIMTWSDVRELAGPGGDALLAGVYEVRYISKSHFSELFCQYKARSFLRMTDGVQESGAGRSHTTSEYPPALQIISF